MLTKFIGVSINNLYPVTFVKNYLKTYIWLFYYPWALLNCFLIYTDREKIAQTVFDDNFDSWEI